MDKATIAMLIRYHYSAFDRVWESVKTLTTAQFLAENNYSLRSVSNHLAHCANVDERWLARLQGQEPPPRLLSHDYPNQAALRIQWDAVRSRVSAYVSQLTDEELQTPVTVKLSDRFPAPRKFARWEILLHIINHGTDHRAQILARLHELGAPTFEQDLALHLWHSD